MIKPTVGRVVWFRPWTSVNVINQTFVQPRAAIITHVYDDTHVNLVVFDPDGQPHPTPMVYLFQGDADRPSAGSFCEWMPFQLGQAAKTEHAESVAKLMAEQQPRMP